MSKVPALEPSEVQKQLAGLPGWQYRDDKLSKVFTFTTYLAGINFVNVVAACAEAKNHHPDLVVGYRRVEVSFTTHDAGHKVSAKDTDIARALEALPLW